MNTADTAELIVGIDLRYIPVVTGMVEQSAITFGLSKESALNLCLAVEELLNVLAASPGTGEKLRVTVRDGGYYTEACCYFPPHRIPVSALNVTKVQNPYDESVIENLGIILAARVVDSLRLVQEQDGTMSICFTVDKIYPEQILPIQALPPGPFVPGPSGQEDIKQFAQRVQQAYPADSPEFFRFPGKVADMVRSREFGIQLATDGKGNVGGGMLWRQGGKMIDALGPYIFVPQPGLAEAIIQKVLENVGRTGAVCMVNRLPVPDVPKAFFEELAPPRIEEPEFLCERPLYRQLEEDTGSTVYVHPDLEPFVRQCIDRLVLPRNIVVTTYAGEFIEPHAAFGVHVARKRHLAILSTIVAGGDAAIVLAQYVSSLEDEGIARIRFRLDLGDESAQVLVPALRSAGFTPCYLLPWGGTGDVVVFEQGNRQGS